MSEPSDAYRYYAWISPIAELDPSNKQMNVAVRDGRGSMAERVASFDIIVPNTDDKHLIQAMAEAGWASQSDEADDFGPGLLRYPVERDGDEPE